MARTISELTVIYKELGDRLESARRDVKDLWSAQEKSADKHTATGTSLAGVTEKLNHLEAAVADPKRAVESAGRDHAELKDGVAELRQELKLSQQALAEFSKRTDVWIGRAWALLMVLVGSLLSLAAGLIVTLARKAP